MVVCVCVCVCVCHRVQSSIQLTSVTRILWLILSKICTVMMYSRPTSNTQLLPGVIVKPANKHISLKPRDST